MFKFNKQNYLNNVSLSPHQFYKELIQATIDDQWTNTTQLYTIKEQEALPFTNIYNDIEVHIDTISDNLVNYSKVYSDFVNILFKNINRAPNYKGQYYKINLDGEHEETYICYDRINPLSQTAECKCVRCNNVLTWIDNEDNIITMPCYLGTDISSTNNLISKDGTISNARMIILIQANEYTKAIVKNQRFLFQHSTAFKVEEVNNYMQEQGTNGDITCIKIYVVDSPLLPNDNTELNICEYRELNNEDVTIGDLHIVVTPNITSLTEKNSAIFNCKVYDSGSVITNQVVRCIASGAESDSFNLVENLDGFVLTNLHKTNIPLVLTFTADNCEDVVMNISLNGLL